MKYIFNNHGRNTICESKVKEYIIYLNNRLINYVGLKVFTNAKQHIDYIKEISQPRKILEDGIECCYLPQLSLAGQYRWF